MNRFPLKTFSPQATDIYHLLLEYNSLTALEIGIKLNILPNAVYRAVKQLVELGFVQKSENYPVKFEVLDSSKAIESYLLSTRQDFQSIFLLNYQNKKFINKLLNISFINNRQELIEQTKKDICNANNEVNIIVSGLEVPAETILEYKKAIERGIKIKILVQRLDEVSREMFLNWEKIGVEVKYFPNMETRIFIFDSQVVYFTSYNPKKKEEGIGARFDYPPFAILMNEIFQQRWSLGKDIRKISDNMIKPEKMKHL